MAIRRKVSEVWNNPGVTPRSRGRNLSAQFTTLKTTATSRKRSEHPTCATTKWVARVEWTANHRGHSRTLSIQERTEAVYDFRGHGRTMLEPDGFVVDATHYFVIIGCRRSGYDSPQTAASGYGLGRISDQSLVSGDLLRGTDQSMDERRHEDFLGRQYIPIKG
jgi:hypothetical protein